MVSLRIVSDAAGRVRFATPALGGSPALAVALEDAVDPVAGVRQVPVYPRSGNVVVWFDPALRAKSRLSHHVLVRGGMYVARDASRATVGAGSGPVRLDAATMRSAGSRLDPVGAHQA
ncbi:MAG: manganese-transporting P-type ATPase [Pseudonocardiales bacterium]|nr:manganese-transporting P-type ATPase [Pseudonocardiales bacterium]